MKLFHKIFICFVVLFGISFQVAGYLMIHFSFQNAMEQEKNFALQEFEYNKYILQSFLYSNPDWGTVSTGMFSVPVAIYEADKKCILSNLSMDSGNVNLAESDNSYLNYQVCQTEKGTRIFVCDMVRMDDIAVYLAVESDIDKQVNSRNDMVFYFQRIYLLIMCIGLPVIFLLSGWLVRSIKKVSEAAGRIADGRYEERIRISRKDEIGELAENFNHMADSIGKKIEELLHQARQKEDFAANFAHEFKTPMTSVIGYADMLYQKDLPREQVKSAAEFILNEGMRLEALSLKLMDLYVMDRQDFRLEEVPVKELFENLRLGIDWICEKNGVSLFLEVEEGSIMVDYDLFQTMIWNVMDNSIKADCAKIGITGEKGENHYQICLWDDGKGIPPEELGRITEAFYMVDKSRSRRQHGAGLGMALVSKIADIHGAEMKIESDGKMGTAVYFTFLQGGVAA